MNSKKDLFQLPDDLHYFNCAYMSPLLKSVEDAGIRGIQRKRNPAEIKPADFFSETVAVKNKFAQLIHGSASQVAIIPSVAYGLKSAVMNIPTNNGNHAITIFDEFPSDYYTIADWCRENKKELKIIKAPDSMENRGQQWTDKLLESIHRDTSAVVMTAIHWTDGTRFDLKKIGQRCKEMNVLFIVDGTQSVGALPMDVSEFQIDALICTGYKWLLGPYSIGLAYYSEFFNNGRPPENSWMNKLNAEDFTKLTNYVEDYKPGAARFNVGESSNFILVPMLSRALDQIHEWEPSAIQHYCRDLIQPLLKFLRENNYWVEDDDHRASHLFGFLLPPTVHREKLLQDLELNKIIVSVRGDAIRVSPHVYNTPEDIESLINVLQKNER